MRRGVVSAVSVFLLGACADLTGPAARSLDPAARPLRLIAGDPFDVTAIDLVPLGLDRTPVDVNERGEMAGSCLDRARWTGLQVNQPQLVGPGIPPHRAFLWSTSGGLRELGTLGGAASCAAAVNDLGQAVGYSLTGSGAVHAFVWTPEGGLRDLGTLPGGTNSRALDINNAGQIVGWSETASGVQQAVLWTLDGGIESLGTLPDRTIGITFWRAGGPSRAIAISERGQVVGWARASSAVQMTVQRPFLWTAASGIRDLVLASEELSGRDYYFPFDINDRGLIVGAVLPSGGDAVGLRIDTTGASFGFANTTKEPSLRCDAAGHASSSSAFVYTRINDAGQVIGHCGSTVRETEAFFVIDALGARKLPLLPGTTPVAGGYLPSAFAYGLSDRGDIVGQIGGGTPSSPAVLWTVRAKAPVEQLVASRASGKCMDVYGAGREPGTPVIIWPCHEQANQRWTLPPAGEAGEVRVYGDMCLDAYGGAGNDWDAIIIWPCHGGANQRWTLTAAGELRGVNGKCVDVSGARTEDLTPLILYGCHGQDNQLWDPRAPTSLLATAAPAAPPSVLSAARAAPPAAARGAGRGAARTGERRRGRAAQPPGCHRYRSRETRPPGPNRTPSCSSSSRWSKVPPGPAPRALTRPWALTTRCQGIALPLASALSA